MSRDIQSLAGLSSIKKRRELSMRLSETVENIKLMNEAVATTEFEDFQLEKAENISKARTLKERTKGKAKLNRKLCEETKLDVLAECFTELVISSLVLDEEYVTENHEGLVNKFKEAYKELLNAGYIKTEGVSPAFTAYITPAVNTFDDIETSIEEPEKIISVLKVAEQEMKDSEDKITITESVKEKVMEVIKEEKIFASKRNFLKESFYKKYDGTSLFNALHIHNFNESKRELLMNEADLTLEKLANDEEKLNELNDNVLAETICDYTLLEVLNTCDMLTENFNANNFKKNLTFLNVQ